MIKNKYFYIVNILITCILTTSCTTITHRKTASYYDADSLYKKAYNKITHHNYIEAIHDLSYLKNLYLFEPYPQQIYLDLIYSYYKSNNLKSANDTIQNFLRLYPNHTNLDYVLYMHGIINMNLDQNNFSFLIKYFNIDWCSQDPVYAKIAFHSFSKLIQNYPNSQYSINSYKRLIFLKNRIANHYLSIIRFYHKKNDYIPVIKRTEKMLHYFPDTQATYQALHYMQQAYQKINLIDQSNKINKIIIENK